MMQNAKLIRATSKSCLIAWKPVTLQQQQPMLAIPASKKLKPPLTKKHQVRDPQLHQHIQAINQFKKSLKDITCLFWPLTAFENPHQHISQFDKTVCEICLVCLNYKNEAQFMKDGDVQYCFLDTRYQYGFKYEWYLTLAVT